MMHNAVFIRRLIPSSWKPMPSILYPCNISVPIKTPGTQHPKSFTLLYQENLHTSQFTSTMKITNFIIPTATLFITTIAVPLHHLSGAEKGVGARGGSMPSSGISGNILYSPGVSHERDLIVDDGGGVSGIGMWLEWRRLYLALELLV